MFPTCKDLFDTSSSDDNSFYGFSKEELNVASKSKSSRILSSPTAISVVTSSTATSKSSSCTVTSSCRLRLRSLKLAESQSEPLAVQQDSSLHLVDSYFSKGSIPSVSSSSLVVTIHPGSSVIATPTVMPTFGSQDWLRSEPVSSYSVRQDGVHVQLQSNQRRHDGFELLSSRPSRQINSGDRLERLEQVVESIALRLGLLVDDDEAKVFEQGNQHGRRSPESEDYSFLDGYAQEEQDSQNKRKIPASDLDEHEEVSVPPTKFRKVDGNSDGEPVVDSDIIFRPLEKDTQRWSIQDVVSDYTLKYFNSVLNEESFQEISKDIGKPDNDLLAPPVLNDIIKKADQVITNKGLLHGDEAIYRCQDHLLTGVFPLLKLWQSVREGVELNEEVFLGSIQRSYVKGLEIPLISKPFQHKIPDSTPESLTEFHLLKLEIDKLLQKGAIEQVESLEPGSFVSRLFTVPKSNGQRRPVINLRQLNKHVYNKKFQMESLGNIRSLLKPGGFMMKIDLQDAYMLVPVAPKSRSLLVFIFDGKIYRFKVMPFGLNSAPRIFTKLFKPILRLLRSPGMLLIIYLDDILLIASTADLCLAQGKFLRKLLQDLGFLVNINKSVLTPTKRIIFLGFLIDSVNMTISLPEEKQLAIIQKANSLLGQNLVSIRNLCQFVGMCSATRPALRQAPLFYRKIQLSINKVLSKAGLNKKLCYNQKIRLNFQVRQNLQWWAEECHTIAQLQYFPHQSM